MPATRDFDQFAAWYSARQKRRTGAPSSGRTVETRVTHVRAIARLMGCADPHDTGLLVQDRERVEQLVENLTARLTPGTVRSYLYSLLSFGEWAKSSGIIQYVALTKADIPAPNPQQHVEVYSKDEIETLIAAARGRELRFWMFLTFIADTGRRVGEVLSIEWDWFCLDNEPPYVVLPMTKNGKPNLVPMTKRLKGMFTDDNIDKLLTEKRNGRRQFNRSPAVHPFPWTYSSVMKRLEHLCATAGVPYRGWHNFRHSLITRRLAEGVPIQAVSALAGHSSVSVTDRLYNHTNALSYWRYVEPE